MRNIFFPTTIIDGFFVDPDSIRKIGLEQEYTDQIELYPGKRSRKNLKEISEMLYDTVMFKFINLFFQKEQVFGISGHASFQLVSKKYNSGWIHRDDPSVATGIIYLSPNDSDTSIGTSLYQKINVLEDSIYRKTPMNKDRFINAPKYEKERELHNNKFKEILNVAGLYNRLFVFDSYYYHAAHNFIGESDEDSRMTIIFNIRGIKCDCYPIQRINHNAITIL